MGVMGVICQVGQNTSCDQDFEVNDSLEDFEALFGADFKLVDD